MTLYDQSVQDFLNNLIYEMPGSDGRDSSGLKDRRSRKDDPLKSKGSSDGKGKDDLRVKASDKPKPDPKASSPEGDDNKKSSTSNDGGAKSAESEGSSVALSPRAPDIPEGILNLMSTALDRKFKEFEEKFAAKHQQKPQAPRRRRQKSPSPDPVTSSSDDFEGQDGDSESSRSSRHNSPMRKRMRSEPKQDLRRHDSASAPVHDISDSDSDSSVDEETKRANDEFDAFLSSSSVKKCPADKGASSSEAKGVKAIDKKISQLAELCEAAETVGDSLHPHLANVYNPLLRKKPIQGVLSELVKLYPRPQNMDSLTVPKTNPAVFKELRKGVQLVDASAQYVQDILSKAMIPTLGLISKIAVENASTDEPKLLLGDHYAELADCLKLTTAGFSLLHQLRKDVIRNDIRSPVASLCNWGHDVGQDLLFGESWIKELQGKSGELSFMQMHNVNSYDAVCSSIVGDISPLNDGSLPTCSSDLALQALNPSDDAVCSSFADEAKQLASLSHKKTEKFAGDKPYGGKKDRSNRYHQSKGKSHHSNEGRHGKDKMNKKWKNKGKKHSRKDEGESEVCVVTSDCLVTPKIQESAQVLDSNVFRKLENTPENFRGGKIASCLKEWKALTSDPWILDVVSGYELEFDEEPYQARIPYPLRLDYDEQKALDDEVRHFIEMGIVEDCPYAERGTGYYSNLFTRPKEDGSKRVILNLKGLTECLEQEHFKMETVRDVILMMRENCNFASIDFKHAFYSIKVHEGSRKYLRFIWRGRHLQFTCMAQGLGPASRVFTKLLKPILSHLRSLGIEISCYIDDSIAIDDDDSESFDADVEYAAVKFDALGYTINVVKSVLPIRGQKCKEIKHLGFIFNSVLMTVKLTDKKKQKIAELASKLLNATQVTIQDLASLVGKLVATEPGFPHAPIHYKHIEIFKNEQLKLHRGNAQAMVSLPANILSLIGWWQSNIFHVLRHVTVPTISHVIESDSSGYAWGGCVDGVNRARGPWSSEEAETMHINLKELTAAFFMLKTYCKDMHDTGIRLKIDNTTAVACISRKASTKIQLMNVTREIWLWALERNIDISAEFLPGRLNQVADEESRVRDNIDTEWMLCPEYFDKLCSRYGEPDVDMFATRLNCQIDTYVSWRPDPNAIAIDAFKQDWSAFDLLYVFPPFSVIQKVLEKLRREAAAAVLVVPMWSTQAWWPTAVAMATAEPVILPRDCLWMPQDANMQHPMKKLQMAAMRVSGRRSESEAYRRTLSTLSGTRGETALTHNIGAISSHGTVFVTRSRLINFALL